MNRIVLAMAACLLLLTGCTAASAPEPSSADDEAYRLVAEHVELPEGMTLLDYGAGSFVDGEEYHAIVAGTDSAEKFTAEIYYYVSLDNRRIFRFDVILQALEEVWSAPEGD